MKTARASTDPGSEFLQSMQEGMDILLGKVAPSRVWHPPASVDVRAVRARTGLSQTQFARRFGFTPAAVREWEQGRRQPEAAARVLLLVIASHPEVVDKVLADAMPVAA
jgi:putative transcriptional regulator